MANILIVDDDKTFRLSLSEGLNELEEGYRIITAENGKKAVELLNTTKVDLVISDLKMPEMDGFELIAYIRKHFAMLPTIVITAFGTPEIEHGVKQLGALQYTEKPIDFDSLIQKISEILNAKSGGFVRGISLPSFLQLIALEKKTCTLTVQARANKGILYFIGGVLTDAETGGLLGEEAALAILAWETGEIEIDGKMSKRKKRIEKPLDFIILEAYRKKDETSRHNVLDLSWEERVLPNPAFKSNRNLKEKNMNTSMLNGIVESIRNDLGEGLIATDVWMVADGQSLAGYNSQPKACALFNRLTAQLKDTLERSNFPGLAEYILLKLSDNKIVVIIELGDYRWGVLADSTKVQLGLLLNVVVPGIVESFEKVLAS